MATTTHPMIGVWDNSDIPEALAAAVKAVGPLPMIDQPEKLEWAKTGEKAPAGRYVDPRGEGVKEAVAKVLAAGKWTRRRVTLAMGFRTSGDFDIVRKALGVKGKPAPAPAPQPAVEAPKGSRPAKRNAAKAAA